MRRFFDLVGHGNGVVLERYAAAFLVRQQLIAAQPESAYAGAAHSSPLTNVAAAIVNTAVLRTLLPPAVKLLNAHSNRRRPQKCLVQEHATDCRVVASGPSCAAIAWDGEGDFTEVGRIGGTD